MKRYLTTHEALVQAEKWNYWGDTKYARERLIRITDIYLEEVNRGKVPKIPRY